MVTPLQTSDGFKCLETNVLGFSNLASTTEPPAQLGPFMCTARRAKVRPPHSGMTSHRSNSRLPRDFGPPVIEVTSPARIVNFERVAEEIVRSGEVGVRVLLNLEIRGDGCAVVSVVRESEVDPAARSYAARDHPSLAPIDSWRREGGRRGLHRHQYPRTGCSNRTPRGQAKTRSRSHGGPRICLHAKIIS